MNLEWIFETVRDVFHVQSNTGIVLALTLLGAVLGGGAGFVVVKRHTAAEIRRLVVNSPEYGDRYVVQPGSQDFRLDTLDSDLRTVGITFVSMSSPGPRPTPESDTVPQQYFQLKNGLYLRAQWRDGRPMPADKRALAEAVILAHETRLRTR